MKKTFILGLAALLSLPLSTGYSLFFLSVLIIIFIYRNEGPILLFAFFAFVSIIPFILESIGLQTTFYQVYYSKSYYNSVYIGYLLFLLIFLYGLDGLKIKFSNFLNKSRGRDVYFVLFVLLQIFILIYGKVGTTILNGSYGSINTSSGIQGLSINEYYLIFLVITLFVYKPNKFIHLLNILFLFKNILYGGRVEALQILFAYSIFLRINLKSIKNIVFGFLIVLCFEVLGAVRSIGLSVFSITSIISNINFFDPNFLKSTTSTFGEVIYSSAVMHSVISQELISFGTRLEVIFYHILSYLMPYSILNTKANIISFIQNISPTGGGGLISSFFYFFGGFPGVILGSLLYKNILKKTIKSKSILFNSVGLLIIITIPRWLIYNHITFVKSSFYLFIILFFLFKIKKNV